MADAARGRWLSVLAGAALLLAVGTMSFVRAWRGEWDFSHFYHDAADAWQHGRLDPHLDLAGGDSGRRLPFYLPAVPALLAPLAALGPTGAAVAWAVMQVASFAYSLYALRKRWAGGDAAFWLAVCLALPAIYEAAKFNQLSFPVLALLLAAHAEFERRRPLGVGLALGLAIVLKLLPGLFLVWLALKRRWACAATTLAACVVIAVVPAVIVFGPRGAASHYNEWWCFNIGGDSMRGLLGSERREHFVDHRNQSITQVVTRWTWPGHPHRMPVQPFELSAPVGIAVGKLIACGLLLVLLWAARRAARDMTDNAARAEWAAFAIAMLALSPLVRQYYLVWALPSLVHFARRSGEPRGASSTVALALWTLGMLAWLSPVEAWGELARAAGVHLALLIALGAILVVDARRGTATGAR